MASRGAALVLLAAATAAVAASAADDGADDALRRLALGAGERQPIVRIGLEPAHAVELTSAAAFRVLDPRTGDEIWRPRFNGVLRVVADGGPAEGVPRIYRIQVGAYATAEAAEGERARLERELGAPARTHHDPDRGTWRVRVGEARERVALQPLMDDLRVRGFADAWITEEPAERVAGVRLRLVDESYASELAPGARIVAVPGGSARIGVDGTEYRGVIEVRITEFGTLRAVNWVGLEHYLLGVVPRELGPEVWPQLEALKAQAVAARTYTWRNRDQFAEEGFDLCATPRCQVYGGASAEHPLSDRAVAATQGEIVVWEGRPIVAYYTATCGGHTEDAGAVFPGADAPYLRGVPCRAEGEALAALRGVLSGRPQAPIVDETGTDATRDWALLAAAGVVDGTDRPSDPIAPERLRAWTTRLARLAGRPAPGGPPGGTSTLGQAAAALAADLGWEERARVLLAGEDLPALLRDDEAARMPEAERRAIAYLAFSEALRPLPDGRFGVAARPTAARMAVALARVAESYEALGLRQGTIAGVGQSSVRLVRDAGELRLDLGPRPALFALTAGRGVPAEKLDLWPGDRVRLRTGRDGTVDFLELVPPVKGVADDRVAAVYSWEERKTRREIEQAISERLALGKLRDLEVVRRGVSGRAVLLRVTGSKGSAEVRGFDVRRLLGLRESLVVIELQRDSAGEIEAVVFAGKGWGHGVGLCQVGAYGMAVRGASYREILAHYYRGARIERLGGD